jgi:putative oxidoreductase
MSDSPGTIVLAIGRLLISVVFVMGGIGKVLGFPIDTAVATRNHVLLPTLAVGAALVIELIGGLAILTGLRTRIAAWILFLYMIPTTLLFHDFWAYDGMVAAAHLAVFEKNLAIMGGLLLLAVHGAGSLSLDSAMKRKQ